MSTDTQLFVLINSKRDLRNYYLFKGKFELIWRMRRRNYVKKICTKWTTRLTSLEWEGKCSVANSSHKVVPFSKHHKNMVLFFKNCIICMTCFAFHNTVIFHAWLWWKVKIGRLVGNTDEVEEDVVGPLNWCFHDVILCLFYISWDARSSEIANKSTSCKQFNVEH